MSTQATVFLPTPLNLHTQPPLTTMAHAQAFGGSKVLQTLGSMLLASL